MAYAPAAPTTFNISPEQFQLLMTGGSLSQGDIDGLLGAPAGVVMDVPSALGAAPTPATAAPEAAAKKSSKKKIAKSSKKKTKGCC
jgi:hypothetical protein